jgi:hypothetical protein
VTFEEVKAALTSSSCERIFQDYASRITGKKIEKRGSSINCGSLGMSLQSGKQLGVWHRFSTNESGNIFKFISIATGASNIEAKEILADSLGLSKSTVRPESYQHQAIQTKEVEKLEPKDVSKAWISYKAVPTVAEAFNPIKHLDFMLKTNELRGVFSYKDAKGQLLGYTVRLEDKETHKKQVLPVSYCYNEVSGKDGWRLKGFTDNQDGKPIYGLEKLAQNNKPILIVEGEKTADKAQELLPEYNVLSWLGGSNGAAKANWNHIAGKDAVIWPDNDLAGVTAATAIAERLNLANDGIGRASVIDTKALGLPEKWDLADQLPESLNIKGVKDILQSSMLEAKSLDAANKVNEIIQGQSSSDVTQLQEKILWQQRGAGNILNFDEVKQEAAKDQFWQEKLTSAEVMLYSKYSEAKGISESSYEFLKLEHPLYCSTLASIAKNIAEAEKDSLDFENKMEHLGAPKLLGKLQDAYDLKLKTSQFAVINNPSYQKLAEELKSSPDRQELFKSAVRDHVILYQEQMNSSLVSPYYVASISTEIHSQIKNYSKPITKSSQSTTLEASDKIAIHDKIYHATQNGSWWKEKTIELLDQTKQQDQLQLLKIAKEQEISLAKLQKEVDFTCRLYRDKIADISHFNPKFDFEQFNQQLLNMPESARDKYIDMLWADVFKEHITPRLDHFDQLKEKAPTIDVHLQALKEQKEFSASLHDRQDLINKARMAFKDTRIGDIMITEKKLPGFLNILERDLKHGVTIGLWTESEALDRLKGTNHLRFLTEDVTNDCRKHYVKDIMKDIEHLDRHQSLTKNGVQFNDHKTYLEYHVHNQSLSPYLQNTAVTAKLSSIYKYEAHQHEQHQAQQKAQELELEKTKTMEKDYGKDGYGI